MLTRKNKTRLAAAAIALVLLTLAVIWWSARPNPESPKWWLRQALRHAREVGDRDEMWVTIHYAIKRHADRGDFAGTKALIHELRSRPFIPAARRWAGNLLRRVGIRIDWLLVPDYLVEPTLRWEGWAYQLLAVAQARAGDINGAQDTARLATRDRYFPFYAEAEIARAQVKAGDLEAAAVTCQWPPRRGEIAIGHENEQRVKARALAALGCALAKNGDMKGAAAAATDVGIDSRMATGYDTEAIVEIALAIADVGHPDVAERLLDIPAPPNWCRPTYYGLAYLLRMAEGQFARGDFEGGKVTLTIAAGRRMVYTSVPDPSGEARTEEKEEPNTANIQWDKIEALVKAGKP